MDFNESVWEDGERAKDEPMEFWCWVCEGVNLAILSQDTAEIVLYWM